MHLRYIEEPSLQFGHNQHLCPRAGISSYAPFDIVNVRPEKIVVGMVGKSEGIEKICSWMETCKSGIPAKPAKKGKRQNLNLFPAFCGFNKTTGFYSEIKWDDTYLRKINNSDFEDIHKRDLDLDTSIKEVANLYLNEIKYLAKNKKPDVILIILHEDLIKHIMAARFAPKTDEELVVTKDDDEDEVAENEQNFRRYIKAKAMQFKIPIQIVRDRISNPTGEMQDPATIAWNFFTALYYKAGGTPWALIRKDMSESTCYAGISFYRSRDKKSTQTSIAQIFNELGKGVILRGEEIVIPKNDRTPHLGELQAYNLLSQSLKEYLEAIKQTPTRLVLHKTSNFNDAEIDGFRAAAQEFHIAQIDLITVMERTNFRLLRENAYPPLRGTQLSFSNKHHLLYTRGSVPYFETYAGMYIPAPIEVRLYHYDESPNVICDEILSLTKMNWNNTQFDRKYPITIECARNVGEILKYLEPGDTMELKYAFYM
jgi:argonaute-like protein implicated in RNA metabolism and viral defense